MTPLFIGQLHQCESSDRDTFDMCYPAQTEIEIIQKVKLEIAQRIIDDLDLEDLDQLRALLNCETKEELSDWFDENMSYYSFSICEYKL